ncbi:MAG: hypothetical protein MJ117_08655, partial [Lachnospiraceae bacterium]|nr:hypothetical protein [Lachnospiraceae bacterium]
MSASDKHSSEWIRETKRKDGVILPEEEPNEAFPEGEEPEEEDLKGDKAIKIVNILIVSILICIIALAAVLLIPMIQKQHTLDLSVPYKASGMVSGSRAETLQNDMQAKLFAADLVVTTDNILNPAINITDETEGNILVNLETKETLYAKNIYTRLFPASVTKLMTGIICMKYGNMDQVVMIQDSDVNLEAGAQLSGLQPGDLLTMNQLLHILLVYSANDAGMAIARTIA